MSTVLTAIIGAILITSSINAHDDGKSETEIPACDATSFEWLSGVWVMDIPDGMIVETWGKDTNWVYHGAGVTIRNGGKVSVEKMRIQQTDSGMVFVADVPHNKGEVSFGLIAGGDGGSMKFVFENATHDYPQRVIYHLKKTSTGDSLYARIEGVVDGKPESADFAYRRK